MWLVLCGALLSFSTSWFYPYHLGSFHWHGNDLKIGPVSTKSWTIYIDETLKWRGAAKRSLKDSMMTSSNGNIFRITGPLCGKFTGHRWIPLTKASDAEFWSAPDQTVEQTAERPVIWDAIALIMTSLYWKPPYSYLKYSGRFLIGRALRQHCCWGVCQLSSHMFSLRRQFSSIVIGIGEWISEYIPRGVVDIKYGGRKALDLVSISDKTFHRTISWSLEAARLAIWIIASLWNLTGTSGALLPRCLSNFRAIV